jgi:hypothetical protein
MHRYRTHTCGALTLAEDGADVRLSGWCHRIRDHGGLLFIDLRDHYGMTPMRGRSGFARLWRSGEAAFGIRDSRRSAPSSGVACTCPDGCARRHEEVAREGGPASLISDCYRETSPRSSNRSRTTSAIFRRSIHGERALRNLDFNSSPPPCIGMRGAQEISSFVDCPYWRR